MIFVLILIVLATVVVIKVRRNQGHSVLIPSLVLGAVVFIGISILMAYIQMFILGGLAVLGLLLALRTGTGNDRGNNRKQIGGKDNKRIR